jgi:DNA-binding CsgD family transcriptional regulator
MDGPPSAAAPRPPAWWPLGLGAVGVLIVIDLVTDWNTGQSLLHMLLELAAFVVIGAVTVAMLRRRERRIGRLSRDLVRSRGEAERWRREAQQVLRGLGAAIDEQFERWGLTPAEREVALLLLKGLSLREVAEVRGTSERTAREQARAVYRKGELSGRSELSAFFLEDLLLPAGATGPARRSSGS